MRNHIRGLTALLVVSALLPVACGTQKKAATYRQEDSSLQEVLQVQTEQVAKAVTDSVQYRFQSLQQEMTELRATFIEQIPMSQVQETIPMQSLLDLPEGAKYGTADGRASVEALRQGDNIVLTGRCDSVARQCTKYEKQTFRQKSTIDSLKAVIDKLHSRLSQMALESESNVNRSVLETQPKVPQRRSGKWFLAGVVKGTAGGVAAQWLWKRFSLDAIIKGLFTKIL